MRKESTMNTGASQYQVSLGRQGLFDIADAAGVTLRCDKGSVWLTLDDDPRDIVLEAGEVYSTDEHRHALVYALSAATITLQAATQLQTRSRRTPEPTRVSFGLHPAAA
jgi:hypothetical protein